MIPLSLYQENIAIAGQLNTLRAVVAALGGTMDRIIRVPEKEPVLLTTPPGRQDISMELMAYYD